MLPLLIKIASTFLVSASVLTNPATDPKLSFEASAFVTIDHQIRVSVQKTADVAVVVLLRSQKNQIVFEKNINRKEAKYAVKLNVDELADGQYELEVKSSEGSIRKQLNLSTQPVQQTNRTIAMQ